MMKNYVQPDSGNLEPLHEKLSELLPTLVASRKPWRVLLHGKGPKITLEVTHFEHVLVRPGPELNARQDGQLVYQVGGD